MGDSNFRPDRPNLARKLKYMTDEALETLKSNTDAITGKLIENPDRAEWLRSFIPGGLYIIKNCVL